MRRTPLFVALFVTACAAQHEELRIERFGTLRGVMRDGEKQGRVVLSAVVEPDSVGIGALAGLEGEILVLDGVAWTARAAADSVRTERATASDRAAFLALAHVPSWRTVELSEEQAIDEIALGASSATTIPFVVEGELAELEMHVLAGRCPFAPGGDPEGEEPVRRRFARATGTLVGFWTSDQPGLLTHHGTNVHVHVLVEEPERIVGHVDSGLVRAGARLRVPAADPR